MSNSATLFLILNHTFTENQTRDARKSLGINRIVELPADLGELWGSIPVDLVSISPYLDPIKTWLASNARKTDYILIQGDFGACFIMVNFALDQGLIPIYSTTKRQATEEVLPDGTVKLVHRFNHHMFRPYEKP